jgi:hypothetical protein
MVKSHPKINFWASGIKRQVAARALRHPDHPLDTLSSSLFRYPTGCGVGLTAGSVLSRCPPLFHRHTVDNGLG